MQPPDELMTGSFLPAMRHLVAIRLRARGLSQTKISSLLGVTQASVSLYLSTDPAKAYGQLSSFSMTRERAERDAAALADDLGRGPVSGLRTLNRIWTGLLGAGSACAPHRALYPFLADCDFCMGEYGGRVGAMSRVVSEVEEAVRLLEGSQEFTEVMPEVSVNIASAAPGASAPEDVVAIPGRIQKVKGRARAMLPPEAGASAHMSKVLLHVMEKRQDLRACINLRYDRKMEKAIKKAGLKTFSIGGYPRGSGEDSTAEALGRKLSAGVGRFQAVVDRGGAGIEPNVYLFAGNPRAVAELALDLAKAYSAG